MRRSRIAGLLGVVLFIPAMAAPAQATATLYQRLGGQAGVDRIARDAVDLYIADPRLRSYFDNINPAWLVPHFAEFVCKVSDGPCVYRGRSMASAHKGLHVNEAAFDAVVEDLQAAMRRQNIPFWTQNRLLARLAPMERDIVTR